MAVIRAAGSLSEVARTAGVKVPSVSNWRRVPPEYCVLFARKFRVPLHDIRPDLYPAELFEAA